GRLIDHLGDQCGEHDDRTAEQNYEHRRAIAGIGEGEVEAAALASRAQRQEALEQLALAAARTAAAQAAGDRQSGRRDMIVHGSKPSFLRMILSENRFPLFGIMRSKQKGGAITPPS